MILQVYIKVFTTEYTQGGPKSKPPTDL